MDLLDRSTVGTYVKRLKALEPDRRPEFGRLTATRMMRHLRHTVEVSLGEVAEEDRSNFFTREVFRLLFFHLVTRWPGGKIKAPDNWTPEPEGDFAFEQKKLIEAMERFADSEKCDPHRKTVSPLLGPITLDYWRNVHGVHFSHHFRQFGL